MGAPDDLVTRLAAIGGRLAGSDAERRAARLLARELRGRGRRPRVQTVWVRPSWGPVLALVCAAGIAGTVVSVDEPRIGASICLIALVLLAGDLSGRLPVLRRLTIARATQNVISLDERDAAIRLVVTAAVDAPRSTALTAGLPARLAAALRRRLGPLAPGGFTIVVVALLLSAAFAELRAHELDETLLGVLQLLPTAALIGAIGVALDHWTSDTGPGANADASACATALDIVEALDRRPPRNLSVDLVLAGAGQAHALGLQRWIAAQRRGGRRPEEVVVLHVAACGAGRPVWWTRDGLVLPLSFHPQLRELVSLVAADEPQLGARAVQGRGCSGARAARGAGWPAIAIGCLPDDDVVPALGRAQDTAEAVDREAMAACRTLCLGLVDALDDELERSLPQD
jgi:hypothetical protein